MNIIIQVYIFVCIMLLLFDVGFLVLKNIKNCKLYSSKNKFQIILKNEFENYSIDTKFSNEFKQNLPNMLSKPGNLIALQNELDNLTDTKDKKDLYLEIKPYVFDQLENYKKKSDYEQAFYAYVISKFDHSQSSVDKNFSTSFIGFLDSKSLYTFTNAMDAIYHFGDVYLMFLAIDKVDTRSGFYHKKLFVDGLLEFHGNCETLHKLILDKFNQYSPLTQESLLDYFRLKGVDISDLCLNILKSSNTNPQVLYSAMRYFAKYPNQSAKQIFINVIQDDSAIWIEEMLAIQALKQYDDFMIKSIIQSKITSPNWYVRLNAVSYLHDQNITREDIFSILSLRDKYANEALLYQYKDDNETSTYILDIIQMLNEEQTEHKKDKDINYQFDLITA